MEAHEAVVRRALYWAGTGLITVNLPLSALRAVQQPAAYRPGFAAGTVAVLAAQLAWAWWLGLRGRSALIPLRVIVVTCCLVLAVHPWVWTGTFRGYPPLFHVAGAGMVISALLGVRVSLLVIAAFATGVALLRADALGTPRAVVEAALLALSGVFATAVVAVLQRAGRSVIGAVDAAWRLQEEVVRGRRRVYELQRWDGLVHDKVLGALRIAVRAPAGVPDGARSLATQALAAFRGDPDQVRRPLAELWRDQARRLGIALDLHLRGPGGGEPGEIEDDEARHAVLEAVNEALTNVARHSGQRQAEVRGELSPTSARLQITDRGRGFAAGPDDWGDGVRLSIVRRMRVVGGSADVHSLPGQGTTVSLRWRAGTPAPVGDPTEWQLRTFVPLITLGVLVAVLNVVMGFGQLRASRWPALGVAAVAVIAALTVVSMAITPSRWNWSPAVLVGAGTATVLAMTAPVDGGSDWRYWYLGALTVPVGAFAYRFRRGAGGWAAAAFTLPVMVVDGLRGWPVWACLTGPIPVMIGAAVSGGLLRVALDRAWRQVQQASAGEATARLDLTVEQERARAAAERVGVLADTVGPALTLIATAEALSVEQIRRLALIEAATRDHLAAPELLDAELVRSVQAARRRGVRVDLVVPDRPGTDAAADQEVSSWGSLSAGASVAASVAASESAAGRAVSARDQLRSLAWEVLQAASSSARVRVVWRPASGRGTITMVGPDAAAVARRMASQVRELPSPRPRLSGDEDSVLIEI